MPCEAKSLFAGQMAVLYSSHVLHIAKHGEEASVARRDLRPAEGARRDSARAANPCSAVAARYGFRGFSRISDEGISRAELSDSHGK